MIYIFGDYELNDALYELRHAGKAVAVEPKAFNILVYLIHHFSRVVTKDELFKKFWPGRFISDSALTRCITMIRKAVQDDGVTQHIIKTVRGHGYRFIATIEIGGIDPPANGYSGSPGTCNQDGIHAKVMQWCSYDALSAKPLPTKVPECMPGTGKAEPLSATNCPNWRTATGQRQHVTVLSAGLQGVTALAQAVDAEVLDAVLERIFILLIGETRRVEGLVYQCTGDSMLALFGATIAHEDHAVRALHAALGMQRGIAACADELRCIYGSNLALRLGIHTGPVVVGTMGNDVHMPFTVRGLTTYLAYHLQQQAKEGSIYVSKAVRQQTDEFFQFTDLGECTIPEVAQPIRIYECKGVSQVALRLEVSRGRRISMFLGREHELDFLSALWIKACNGQGKIVCLFGEAGIGKSRLAHEFRHSLTAARLLQIQAVPYGQAIPYQAVVPMLYSLLELVDTTPPHLLRQQVRTQLAAISSSLATDEPLLSRLLGISLEPDVPPALPPEEQKRRLRNVCRQVIAHQALVQPFCLLVEDGQWLDSGSQELLDLLVAMLPRLPLLILVTARPGFHHLWEDSTSYHRLTLPPLRREHTDAIVFHWCLPYKASAALRALIYERTEGNPFFIEGILRTLQDQQLLVLQDDTFVLRAGAALALPSSIHRVLAACIDRLAPDLKEVVQVGAVIGREFPLWLLEAVIGRTDLHSTLTTLSRLELIREKVSQSEPTYIFKHARRTSCGSCRSPTCTQHATSA